MGAGPQGGQQVLVIGEFSFGFEYQCLFGEVAGERFSERLKAYCDSYLYPLPFSSSPVGPERRPDVHKPTRARCCKSALPHQKI